MAKKINYEELSREKIISEIMKKKEFSDLPKKDVELVYSQFEGKDCLEEDKIKLTRDLLRKMYTAFVSDKLLNVKDKDADWFLKKHISTKERLKFYEEVYLRCLERKDEILRNQLAHPNSHSVAPKTFAIEGARRCSPTLKRKISKKVKGEKLNIIDFGCGINGFSYEYFKKIGYDVKYIGIEPVGQLVNLQNNYFEKNEFNAECFKASLFDLNEIRKIVSKTKSPRVGFFFKVLDSLEMLKRDYSKEVLRELVPMFEKCVLSWATASLVSRKKFHAERKWLKDFIDKEFFIFDEFEIGGENYLVFGRK
jgi:hypothetical protein